MKFSPYFSNILLGTVLLSLLTVSKDFNNKFKISVKLSELKRYRYPFSIQNL